MYRPSGEYVLEARPWQLLSLGCRTANKPNQIGADAGAVAVARLVRPRTLRPANRPATRPRRSRIGPVHHVVDRSGCAPCMRLPPVGSSSTVSTGRATGR